MHLRKMPRWLREVREHQLARNLTRGEEAALRALYWSDGPDGRTSSWERLGDLSHTSRATVGRAIRQARHLGLLVSLPRRRREGWRWVRSSNRYILSPGSGQPVVKNLRKKADRKPRPSKAHDEPGVGKVSSSEPTWPEIRAAREALATVAAQRLATILLPQGS